MSFSHSKSLSIGSLNSSASASRSEPPPLNPPAYSDRTGTSKFDFEGLDFTPNPLEIPSKAECVAHLRLLNAFNQLRYEVGSHEDLFEIHAPDVVNDSDRIRITEWLKEKRWAVYVTRAVDRFEKWWDTLPKTSHRHLVHLRTTDFDASGTGRTSNPRSFPVRGKPLEMQNLPPLDVLMVWHAYMLNPRTYLEDCMRLSRHDLWATPFPWESIYKHIDADTFVFAPQDITPDSKVVAFVDAPRSVAPEWDGSTFNVPPSNPPRPPKHFTACTGLPWDNLDDADKKRISCPACSSMITVPWTVPPIGRLYNPFETFMDHDTGFAGKDFTTKCGICHLTITHEKLRVAKFTKDCDALLFQKRPLPGTILGFDGIPEVTAAKKTLGNHDLFFPNRLVENMVDFQFSFKTNPNLTMDSVKQRIELIILTTWQRSKVNMDQHNPDFVAKKSKNAVRRMMAQYWDNASPFGIDLVGAVIRQGTFIQKMHKIDWYHSPAVLATMDRSILKYHRFIGIIADNPKKTAVPTLDIDLAWHTHQLNPKVYFKYTVAETKKFVNHDDKIPEGDLSNFFKWTCITYERKYGKPYSECSCWYCECTRDAAYVSLVSKINPIAKAKAWEVGIRRTRFPTDPVNGPHISTHNAIKWTADGASQRKGLVDEHNAAYLKTCKNAKKKGRNPPPRDDHAYLYSPYGYPVYVPYYEPYVADPTINECAYPTGPTQAENRPGAAGACAAGTCGGMIGLGSCAGDAGPSCATACGGHGDALGGCGTCGGGDGGDGGGCGGCG